MKFPRKRIYGINPDADSARLHRIVAATNAVIARGNRSGIILGHNRKARVAHIGESRGIVALQAGDIAISRESESYIGECA